jgi:NADPH-dependent F420 reductase
VSETIAIIGGTGPEGRGLATRLAMAGHAIVLGSRDAERGAAIAAELAESLGGRVAAGALRGTGNAEACAEATLAIVTVPYAAHAATLELLRAPLAGKLVIDAAVPVRFERGPRPVEVEAGSATEEAAALLPDSTVVGAFHNLDAESLLDPDARVDADVLVTGGAEGKQRASALAEQIEGVRAVDAGPLRFSRFVEGLTILLIGLNGRHKAHTGVRIAGLPPPSR